MLPRSHTYTVLSSGPETIPDLSAGKMDTDIITAAVVNHADPVLSRGTSAAATEAIDHA